MYFEEAMVIGSQLLDGAVTAMFAALTGLGAYFVQDYLSSRKERRKEIQTKLEDFQQYASPLGSALESLFYRLREIFNKKAKFLLKLAPNNEYYQYRYISSMYRLCLVLGWLKLAEEHMHQLVPVDDLGKLEEAIDKFRSALATAHNIERDRLIYLVKKWNIALDDLKPDQLIEVEESIRNQIWDALSSGDKNYAYDLEEGEQLNLLQKIADEICKLAEIEPIDAEIVASHRTTCVRAISRTESWIYRDWQLAIGNFMLIPPPAGALVDKREIMSFRKFEDMYLKHRSHESPNRWLGRIDNLFHDLDVEDDEKFDARIPQLRNICLASVDLFDAVSSLNHDDEEGKQKLESMREFIQTGPFD